MGAQSVLKNILLPFQILLAFWQIVKLTPLGAIIQCVVGWLLLPFGLSPTYSRLLCFPGRVLKTVQCHVITEADQPTLLSDYIKTHEIFDIKSSYLGCEIDSSYLGHPFRIERKEGSKMFLYTKLDHGEWKDGGMAYYITDTIWYYLVRMGQVAPNTVFLKGYKPVLPQVATGGVMTLQEVLDCVIINNKAIGVLDNYLLLPVNLSVSDLTMLKFVNGGGLFLLLITKHHKWAIAATITILSAMLEFSPRLRDRLYANISRLFSWAMLLLCEKLPPSMKRRLHSSGIWVEKLKFSNHTQLGVPCKSKICAVIGGGAKVSREDATLVPWLNMTVEVDGREKTFPCGAVELKCRFDERKSKCVVWANTVAAFDVYCDWDEFVKLCTFLSCIAKSGLGSLKYCGRMNSVRVRGFKSSVICYAKSGFPSVYELTLEKAIIQY